MMTHIINDALKAKDPSIKTCSIIVSKKSWNEAAVSLEEIHFNKLWGLIGYQLGLMVFAHLPCCLFVTIAG